jgi:SAM-dependent methyltransferase
VKVHERVARILAEREPGTLLDVPAGYGPMGTAAADAGHRVVGLDLFPPKGFEGVQADACGTFPFAEGSFDYVLSMEGIEHFENQAGFVRECARVLKPGGTFLLTTPNVLHLSSRFASFWTGQRTLRGGFVNEFHTLRGGEGDRLHHGHAFLVDVFRLRYFMAIAGLRLEAVHSSNFSGFSLCLLPLLPLVALATEVTLRGGRRHVKKLDRPELPADTELELRRIARNPALLLSRKLIVSGRKIDAGAGAAVSANGA